MEIADKVKKIISDKLDVDIEQIKPESQFIEDFGADSLAIVELVLAFEEQFEIEIPDEDTEKIRTVQDAINYITLRLGASSKDAPRQSA
ncbi:MAG: acyl carrier protein [Deltaproteobacteria bacterium]|nr:acyl carrier protein [Sandaracinaceae bacterium]MCX7808705.1 acyl carrier protein [Deltaproteobacteria bacterium]MDW8247287.1 acyl carrier protein [Sandaracinaceae bacterium]